MSETDRRYWIGFSRVSGIGAARLRVLIGHFGDPENAWNAPAHERASNRGRNGSIQYS